MKDNNNYNWQYCSVGGVVRVKVASGEDLAHLGELDQKLWTVLSCPTKGLEFDAKTLELMDADADGKIRVPEVVSAAEWLTTVIKDRDSILEGRKALLRLVRLPCLQFLRAEFEVRYTRGTEGTD